MVLIHRSEIIRAEKRLCHLFFSPWKGEEKRFQYGNVNKSLVEEVVQIQYKYCTILVYST